MDNLLKMIDFIADFIYAVFDLIWRLQIPGTNIQIVFILIVNLVIDLVIWFVLGSFAYASSKTKPNPNAKSISQNWGKDKE